ncbi:polysaccharide pyruvyl transferase family protein [Donghicola sp. C2-DW-16]|uniref:Polysaccharide pyruvyl transferase family protein n=1 Tax=Donghicola mangrovi TaxID=2729614 RepID=A0ABX2PJ93_9RHOB|nr:polysaccharide pyruvyl transferase family protein [Donghicola mangrovi]NVO29176.1 polysaccharide pyruvyl transferase family protein [Donghicola mangrovi]
MSHLKSPLVLGVNVEAVKSSTSISQMLARTGQNTGNMLFSNACYSIFEGAKNVQFAEVNDQHLEGRDCIILSAANWLGQNSEWRPALVDWLASTNLPVIALGLGAQSGLNGGIPALRPSTKKLISILAERSPGIAARGTFTCEVLEHYGAKNAVPTGCPSMLLNRGKPFNFASSTELPRLEAKDVSIHGTRHHYKQADEFHAHFYHQAISIGCDIVLQSELPDFYPSLGRFDSDTDVERLKGFLEVAYQSSYDRVEKYLSQHGKVFFSIREWTEFCNEKKFIFGTRIHGTIASLLAGTPALLVAHDSRTKELADSMGIAYVEKGKFDFQKASLNDLFEICIHHDFNAGHQKYFSDYLEFFDKCSIRTNLVAT